MTPSFGKAGGGGRRGRSRQATSLLTSLSTLSRSYQASLVDISATGARLKAARLPAAGESGNLHVGAFTLFGEVRWSGRGQCGFAFFEPLTAFALASITRDFRCRKEDAEVQAARQRWTTERLQ